MHFTKLQSYPISNRFAKCYARINTIVISKKECTLSYKKVL